MQTTQADPDAPTVKQYPSPAEELAQKNPNISFEISVDVHLFAATAVWPAPHGPLDAVVVVVVVVDDEVVVVALVVVVVVDAVVVVVVHGVLQFG